MVPQINISQSLYDKIKGLAEPFVDSPESVITRCVEFYVSSNGAPKPATPPSGSNGILIFPGDAAPNLTFTRILSVKLDGDALNKSSLYWNTLMYEVVARAASKLKSMEKLKQLILVNYVDGEGSQKLGYRFIPGAGLSVQGQDANSAWKTIFHIAKSLGMTIDVVFMWENKDKALHPGKSGRMTLEEV
ncbi:MAG TPA: hypothetical protein VGL12_04510 [Roseiarcus sp.]